jgi:hypothetical protein
MVREIPVWKTLLYVRAYLFKNSFLFWFCIAYNPFQIGLRNTITNLWSPISQRVCIFKHDHCRFHGAIWITIEPSMTEVNLTQAEQQCEGWKIQPCLSNFRLSLHQLIDLSSHPSVVSSTVANSVNSVIERSWVSGYCIHTYIVKCWMFSCTVHWVMTFV